MHKMIWKQFSVHLEKVLFTIQIEFLWSVVQFLKQLKLIFRIKKLLKLCWKKKLLCIARLFRHTYEKHIDFFANKNEFINKGMTEILLFQHTQTVRKRGKNFHRRNIICVCVWRICFKIWNMCWKILFITMCIISFSTDLFVTIRTKRYKVSFNIALATSNEFALFYFSSEMIFMFFQILCNVDTSTPVRYSNAFIIYHDFRMWWKLFSICTNLLTFLSLTRQFPFWIHIFYSLI